MQTFSSADTKDLKRLCNRCNRVNSQAPLTPGINKIVDANFQKAPHKAYQPYLHGQGHSKDIFSCSPVSGRQANPDKDFYKNSEEAKRFRHILNLTLLWTNERTDGHPSIGSRSETTGDQVQLSAWLDLAQSQTDGFWSPCHSTPSLLARSHVARDWPAGMCLVV